MNRLASSPAAQYSLYSLHCTTAILVQQPYVRLLRTSSRTIRSHQPTPPPPPAGAFTWIRCQGCDGRVSIGADHAPGAGDGVFLPMERD